jgi:hypothetical protein
MKKSIVIVLLALACSTAVFAQHFDLGAKAGVNISNFVGGNFQDVAKSSLVGFHVGGFIDLMFGNHFALQPELLFSSQGARLESAGNKENFRVSYIMIPIMLKYTFEGGFYLEAGPQFGFKVSENTPNQTIENFAKGSDLSAGVGLGYHSRFGLGIGARYLAGLSKVGDFNGANIDPDFRNSVIQIGLFYTFFNHHK